MKTSTLLRLAAALGAVALVLCAVVFFLLGRLSGKGASILPELHAQDPARVERVSIGGHLGAS